jgi:NADPH:quinone reductase
MRALQIDRYGPLSDLAVREVAEAPLPADSVRIQIEAAAVNPSDAGVALGRFPRATLPRILGRDFAGRVIEGPPAAIGTLVWGSGGGELGLTRDGSHAERLVIPAAAAIARPPHLTAEEAAAVGVPFVTAWSALVDLAGVRAGEYALISGAAGAVGSAAAQLAAALGAQPIALVLERTDLAPLEGVALAGVVRTDREDVPARVREITGGRGAEIALNGVGSSLFPALYGSLAAGGRMVVFSARWGRTTELDLFTLYRGELRLYGLDTAALRLSDVARIYEKLRPHFESRALRPPAIAARFPLERARDAYERVESGSGKIVLLPRG